MDCVIGWSLLPVSVQTTIVKVAQPVLALLLAALFWLVVWCVSAYKAKASDQTMPDDSAPKLRYKLRALPASSTQRVSTFQVPTGPLLRMLCAGSTCASAWH